MTLEQAKVIILLLIFLIIVVLYSLIQQRIWIEDSKRRLKEAGRMK